MLLDQVGDLEQVVRALMRTDLATICLLRSALRAAFTASSTSALSPSAASARTSSLAGLMVSKVLPDLAGTHLPPMRSCLGLR